MTFFWLATVHGVAGFFLRRPLLEVLTTLEGALRVMALGLGRFIVAGAGKRSPGRGTCTVAEQPTVYASVPAS